MVLEVTPASTEAVGKLEDVVEPPVEPPIESPASRLQAVPLLILHETPVTSAVSRHR